MYRKLMFTLLGLCLAVIGVELLRSNTPAKPGIITSLNARRGDADGLLERRVAELVLHHGDTADAVRMLQDKAGVPIVVDWGLLEGWRKIPVDLEWHDITVGDAIAYLFSFRKATYENYPVEFDVVGGKVLVEAVCLLPSSVVTQRVYDYRDLLTDDYWGGAPSTRPEYPWCSRPGAVYDFISDYGGIRNWGRQPQGGTPGGSPRMDGLALVTSFASRDFVIQTSYNHRLIESAIHQLRDSNSRTPAELLLDRRIDHVEFRSVPFYAVIHALAAKTGASFAFEMQEPGSLGAIEPAPDLNAPITVAFDHVTLGAALTAMTKLVDGMQLAEYENGQIVIRRTWTDFRDMAVEVIDATALVRITGQPWADEAVAFSFAQDGQPLTASGKELCAVLGGGARDCTFIGTRVIFAGDLLQRRHARDMVDCLAHPVNLNLAESPPLADQPTRRLERFTLDNVSGSAALSQWRAAAGPNVVWLLTSPVGPGDEKASLDLHDVSLEDSLIAVIRFPGLSQDVAYSVAGGLIYVGTSDDIEPSNIRAYDVSSILANSAKWFQPAAKEDAESAEDRKVNALIGSIEHDLDANSQAIHWHGRLVLQATPEGHRRIFQALRHVQLTGELPPRPQE